MSQKTIRPTTVIINKDLSVRIPANMLYSTDKSEIDQHRILVYIKEEKNEIFEERMIDDGDISLAQPFSAPQCLTITEPKAFPQNANFEIDLTDRFFRKEMFKTAKEISMFGGDAVVFKESKDILIYYNINRSSFIYGVNFLIITPKYWYNGQIWANDAVDKQPIVESFLSGIDRYIPSETDKVQSKPFAIPTYNNGVFSHIGTLKVAVPDQMKSLKESEADFCNSPGSEAEYVRLTDKFEFLTIPKDFKEGFRHYPNAAFSMVCESSEIVAVPEFAKLRQWERRKRFSKEVEEYFCEVDTPADEIHCLGLPKSIDVIYFFADESSDTSTYRCRYLVAFLHTDKIYPVNIYITAKKDKPKFEAALREWIKLTETVSVGECESFDMEHTKKVLGKYLAEDGKFDAVKAAQLFCKDVTFNNNDEIEFDGKHHRMRTLQFNSLVLGSYPEIESNMALYRANILEVVSYVEKNEDLMISKSMFSRKLLNATRNQPITGGSIFDFCSYHMVNLAQEGSNEYSVFVDYNLMKGIPGCCEFIAEFIKTLRRYNGRNDDFTVTVTAAIVFESPTEEITVPVVGAEKLTEKTIKVSGNDNLYKSIIERTAEFKEAKKTFNRTKENDKNAEWKTEFLSDGTVGIVSYNGSETTVTVPSEINGIKVTRICHEAFCPDQGKAKRDIRKNREKIEKVILPDTVTEIEDSVFSCCSNLRSIRMSENLIKIGDNAFSDTGLTEIVLPESVSYIGSCVFQYCRELEKVVFPKGKCEIGRCIFIGSGKISNNVISNEGSDFVLYSRTNKQTQFSVPEGVTKIYNNAFFNDYLEELFLPKSLREIEGYSISGESLKSIVFLSDNAEVTNYSYETSGAIRAAGKCNEMIYSNDKSILYFCPLGAQQASMTIPDTVKNIEHGAFMYCRRIKQLHIPKSVESIASGALPQTNGKIIEIYAPTGSYAEDFVKRGNLFSDSGYCFIPEER